jgi:hypothetical protein
VSETPANIPTSCAAVAAELVVGCLPIIQGAPKGKAPVQPMVLTKEEKAKLGIVGGDHLTLFYPAGGDGVFFDGSANTFRIWFSGEDSAEVTNALHNALTRAFPAAQQLDDVAHKIDPRMRARAYRVELGGNKLATIRTSFADLGPGKHRFEAEVKSLQRAG